MISTSYLAKTPEDVGIDSEKLERVFARAKRDVDQGVLPGCQVAVARNGRVAGMRNFGVAVQGGSEKAISDETLFAIFSCTKAIVAVAIWQILFEDKLIRLDEKVADIIPEFGANGKEVVTLEQVLLHTGGFPYSFYVPVPDERSRLLDAFASWKLDWEPGSRYEYHAESAHWVLAEVIFRRTGTDYREFLRSRVLDPMGLTELFVGLPPQFDARVADIQYVGEMIEPPGGWGLVTPEHILAFNLPQVRQVGIPGGGGIGTAADLALFYQALLNGGETVDGRQVVRPETIAAGTKVRTKEYHRDPALDIPINRGLSIQVAGGDGNAYLRGFGRVASPNTFGHAGAGGQMAWGDPQSGISLGYCTQAFSDWMTTGRRVTAISSLAAGCAIDG